jgi:hypothetical protein
MERAKIAKTMPLGGGMSTTLEVTLEDGSLAVFRALDYNKVGAFDTRDEFRRSSRLAASKDVAAFLVADLVGMGDMVPAAAIRELKHDAGETAHGEALDTVIGALCEWQEGTPAGLVSGRESLGDSVHDARRAAMFDWMTQNADRHSRNWLVDGGKVRLIDHNKAFEGHTYSMFIKMLRGSDDIEPDRISQAEFKALIEPYRKALPQIKTRLSKVGIPERFIKQLEVRVNNAVALSTEKLGPTRTYWDFF